MTNIAGYSWSDRKLYIVQLLGIIVLLCGYLISNQPDSMSVMHFDPNPVCPSVFHKALRPLPGGGAGETSISSDSHHPRKGRSVKFFSFEVILPIAGRYIFHPVNRVVYTCLLREQYNYLFFAEINPPPPKVC